MASVSNIRNNLTNDSTVDISKNDNNSMDIKLKNLLQENKKLNDCLTEQEEALFTEMQKNAKLEKVNTELYEQVNFYKMEVVDLNRKVSYITDKINCDDIIKDLIYKQQQEIISLRAELTMSKSSNSQLKSRLKSQVEELKFIKRQSMQITSDMAKEVESQIANIQHQLVDANKTIESQQEIINSSKKLKENYENLKSELVETQNKLKEEIANNERKDENLKLGVKALFSIIGDLEKSNDEAVVFFNEAGEEIRSLKEQMNNERKDYNVMVNEMGQEIINLNQQNYNYQRKIKHLTNAIATNNRKMATYCQSTLTQIYECINSIKSNLCNFKSDTNTSKYALIKEMSAKVNEIVEILVQHEVKVQDDFINDFNKLGNQMIIKRSDSMDDSKEVYEEDELYNEKLESLERMYNDSIKTINEMGNELIESKLQNENNSEKVKALSDMVMKLMEAIVELEEDKASLQKNVDEYLDVINDCGEDIRKLHFTEKDLITAITESGHEICVLKQKIENMISYQEKYMSIDGEVLMNKVSTLTTRNQELEKELTILKKFDINKSLKKTLEEGQLQSAFYEIKKLRNYLDRLTQNYKQVEKDLANARSEISSIILTRDEAIINQEEALENLDILQRLYAKQVHRLRNEVFRIYSAMPSEVNNRILNLVNELQMVPNMNSIQYEVNIRNARAEAAENKLHEAEEIIDSLTRENFEYQKKLNKINNINEKLVAKLLLLNKKNQELNISLSQSSNDSFNNYIASKHSQDHEFPPNLSPPNLSPLNHYSKSNNNINNSRSPVYVSPSVTPVPPPHGTPQNLLPIRMNTPPSTNIYHNNTTDANINPNNNNSIDNSSQNNSSNNNNNSDNPNSNSSFIKSSMTQSSIPSSIPSSNTTNSNLPPPPLPVNILKKSSPHILKVKQSLENLNKRGIKKASSQLCLQSSLQSTDLNIPPSSKLSNNISSISSKANDFTLKESKEEYNKLLNHFGSIPHNKRVSSIKEEYNEMKDYMSFEIQNQNQIMEAIKSGEIPFYSSDNEDDTEVLVINDYE
jgi:chromosome segregation ATPase